MASRVRFDGTVKYTSCCLGFGIVFHHDSGASLLHGQVLCWSFAVGFIYG